MASRDEIIDLAAETTLAVKTGAFTEDQLTEKGRALLRFGRGDLDLNRLSPQDRALIGLDPTLMQRARDLVAPVAASAPFQALTGTREPKYTESPAYTAIEPTGTALTTPPLAITGEPGSLERLATTLGRWPLKAMEVGFAPLLGGARLVEQGVEHLPRIVGQPPASTPVSRIAGALAEGLAMVAPGLKKPPSPPTPPMRFIHEPPPPPPMKALPPGETFTIVPPHARTRSMLEAGQPPRALPPAPAEVPEVPDFWSLPEVLDALPPGVEPRAITGRVVGQTKALPPPRLTEPQRGLALPGTVPLGETGEGGALVVGGPPEAPVAPARPVVAPAAPTTPPPPVKVPPPPIAAKPTPPPVKVPRGKGGLSSMLPPVPLPGAEEGDDADTATIKTAAQALGLSLPLVSMLFSRWRGGPRRPKQQGFGFEGPGPQKDLFGAPLPEVPAPPVAKTAPVRWAFWQDVRGKPSLEQWHLTEDIPGHPKGSTLSRQTLETEGFTVPTPPGYEKTPLGDQALVPGLPPREIPTTPLRPGQPQADITETPLFGQERGARETAGEAAQGRLALPSVPEAPAPSNLQRAITALPPVPAGQIRLYRAEGTPTGKQMPEWIERGRRESGAAAATGRWFTDDPKLVEWYANEAEAPRFLYLDVPRETAEAYRLSALARAKHPAARFSRDPEHEFFLAPQLATGRQEISLSRQRPPQLPEPPGAPPADLFGERGSFLPGAKLFGKEEPPSPVSGRPPQVPARYRAERAGRQPLPEGEAQPPAYVADGVRQTVEDIRARRSGDVPPIGEGLPPGGTTAPPPRTLMPADVPEDPAPQLSRFVRSLTWLRTARPLRNWNVPEDVVASDPVATRVVRTTYRAGDNQLALRRELEDAFEQAFAGLPETSVEQIGKALDTAIPGRVQYGPEAMAQEAAALRRMLPADLAERAIQARDLIVRYTDATGLPQANRFASYFPHFRDRVRVNETTLVLDPEGQPYLSQSYEVPKRLEAFFHKPRTNEDPPSHFGRDAFRIFARATARHLTLNGGDHPFTGERLNGYLNDIAPQLSAVMPELRPYTADFVNHFLGTPGARPGSPGGHQVSRIARNLQGARLLSGPGSMIVNATQQSNTLALVRPSSWLRGYADLLDPERRALAQRWIGLEELGKADLERVQQISSGLDKIEDMSGKLAQVTMTGFRKVETGNRYHAFLAGLRDAEAFGLEGRNAIEYARDIAEQGQFPTMAAARPEIARSDWGAALWQMKQFQTRQALFVKNLIRDDVKDLVRAAKGEDVPIEIGGRPVLRPDGTPYTRDPVSLRNLPMHRTAKFIAITTLIGGPDALFPGLDDYLREQDIKIPGLLPALGAGIASLSAYGFISPGDLTRSIMFALPGPLIGNVQDALSAATGKNFGHGLNEFLAMTELSLDQQVEAGVRSVPGLGVFGAKLLRATRGAQTPGEERASLTPREAFALEPSRGPLVRRAEPLDPLRLGFGLQPAEKEQIRGERTELADLDARAKRAVQLAADDYAAGEPARGDARLRDAEQRLKLPPGSLEVSKQAEKAAEQRRGFTPLERRQFEMRTRFPDVVERSRRRIPGEEPEEPGRRGLGIPRLRLR